MLTWSTLVSYSSNYPKLATIVKAFIIGICIATHFSHKAERAPFFSHDDKFHVTAYTGNIQKYDLGHKHRRDMYPKNNRIR